MTVLVSLLSLVVSGFAAFKAYGLADQQLQILAHAEFQKCWLAINGEVLRDPNLWAYSKSFQARFAQASRPLEAGKLEAFGFMMLNTWELIFEYHQTRNRSRHECRLWDVWHRTITTVLHDSPLLQGLASREDVLVCYSQEFREYLQDLLAKMNSARPVT
jgi:hypothetical protein